jgi:MFS family permease
MFFNMFVFFDIAPSLDTVTLMVQLSGVAATAVTLVAGTLSDKIGNRRSFISIGYIIWGVTVALFGCLSPDLVGGIFGMPYEEAVSLCLVLVVIADCVMTLFGSTANDAAFNAWVTDNTDSSNRGKIEGILSILPLIAMLIVAGGFGILKDLMGGYRNLFISLGAVISLSGILGIRIIKDAPTLEKNGGFKDIFYGFLPSVVKNNASFYITLIIVLIYGIACQVFMPYMIIFMTTYLGFEVLEYSLVFGIAILGGAGVNLYLTRLSDKKDKVKMMYLAAAIFAIGLVGLYLASMVSGKIPLLILFGVAGFVMITGYIFVSALSGSVVRDYTPEGAVGKLQGVRMIASVLIPMLIGPAIGNGINKLRDVKLPDMNSADVMTTAYVPAPEIFLVGGILALLLFAVIPILAKVTKK